MQKFVITYDDVESKEIGIRDKRQNHKEGKEKREGNFGWTEVLNSYGSNFPGLLVEACYRSHKCWNMSDSSTYDRSIVDFEADEPTDDCKNFYVARQEILLSILARQSKEGAA